MHLRLIRNASTLQLPGTTAISCAGNARTRLLLALFFFLFLVAGCSSSAKWVKAGAGDADLERDRIECRREAGMDSRPLSADMTATPGSVGSMRSVGVMDQKFEVCMQARGWRKSGR